jgi:Ca2+-binding RTX toxin-like protein
MATFYGTPGDDNLVGSSRDDLLFGGDGNDTLNGNNGYDFIDGGNGNDSTRYDFYSKGIIADLQTGVVSFPGLSPRTETLVSIENILGSRGNDIITGTAEANRIEGYLGDDQLYGGAGDDWLDGGYGYDHLDGGEGTDTASYEFYDRGISANLQTGVVGFPKESSPRTETLVSIENLIGSRGDDTIVGNTQSNLLNGSEGRDTLLGDYGDDQLVGGTGADQLDGQWGNDYLDGFGGLGDELDILTGGQGSDVFAIGNGTYASYLGSGFATITDFSRSQRDKIQVNGSVSDYSLVRGSSVNGATSRDTAIYRGGDLIAIVQGSSRLSVAAGLVGVLA